MESLTKAKYLVIIALLFEYEVNLIKMSRKTVAILYIFIVLKTYE